MAKTFKALCDYANWDSVQNVPPEARDKAEEKPKINTDKGSPTARVGAAVGLHYNIQIHLPPTRDSAVYDAIFKSLRDHLL